MRFGLVHRIMTDTLGLLGVLALVTSSPFSEGVMYIILAAMVGAIAMRESWRQQAAERHIDTIAVIILTVGQVVRGSTTSTSILDLLIQFAVGLQIIRVATRRGAAHDQQIIVLALLHLIAGTVVGGGLGYGLCFFGLLIVTPGALVLSHLRREVEGNYRQGARDRTGLPVDVPRILRSKRVVGRNFILATCLLSVPILLFTVSLFIVFPRVGLSLLLMNRTSGDRMVGFSDSVDLGQIGTLRTDPTIALRVTFDQLPEPPPERMLLHLRGTALDHYDGRTWSQSQKFKQSLATAGDLLVLSSMPDVGRDAKMHIELEPIDPPVLFVPRFASGLRVIRDSTTSTAILRGPEGELRYQAGTGRGARYDVFLSSPRKPTFRRLSKRQRKRHLQLPNNLSPRVVELAKTWTEGSKDKLAAIETIHRRLRTQYQYDLASPSGLEDDPLADFLFSSKRGHCEYFSTAMAVMLRTLDIPARNVTGFVGGSYNKYGNFYAVRQGDAHSWVEVFIRDRGWVTYDPTPPTAAVPQSELDGVFASLRDLFEAFSQRWSQHVIGYDLRQQIGLIESLRRREQTGPSWLRQPSKRVKIAMLGIVITVGSIFFIYRRRREQGPNKSRKKKGISKDALLASKLYSKLDQTMTAIGLGRDKSVPPMLHARKLAETDSPGAGTIRKLTQIYIDTRFGGLNLTSQQHEFFEQSIRELKNQRAVER